MGTCGRLLFALGVTASAGCAALLNIDPAGYGGAPDGSVEDGASNADGPNPTDGGGGGDSGIDAAPTCTPVPSFALDKDNCGRCGHNCIRGACAGGECQPFEISPDGNGTHDIAASDAFAYWINVQNELRRISIAAPGTAFLYPHPPNTAFNAITNDGDLVYIATSTAAANSGAIGACNLAQCDGGPPLKSSLTSVRSMKFVSGAFLWTENGRPGLFSSVNSTVGPPESSGDVAVASNGVFYWSSTDAGASVRSATTTTTQVIASEPPPGLRAIAADDKYVFFAGHQNKLVRIDHQGANATPFPATDLVNALASDGRFVYWAEAAGIKRSPVGDNSTGAVQVLEALGAYRAIAVGPTFVVWADQRSVGKVWAVAR